MGRKKRKHASMAKKQKEQAILPKETSELTIEKMLSLSDRDYSIYYIISAKEKVGYLGVYPSGKFNYSIIQEDANEDEIMIRIRNFIREELKLTPVVNPKLYVA